MTRVSKRVIFGPEWPIRNSGRDTSRKFLYPQVFFARKRHNFAYAAEIILSRIIRFRRWLIHQTQHTRWCRISYSVFKHVRFNRTLYVFAPVRIRANIQIYFLRDGFLQAIYSSRTVPNYLRLLHVKCFSFFNQTFTYSIWNSGVSTALALHLRCPTNVIWIRFYFIFSIAV